MKAPGGGVCVERAQCGMPTFGAEKIRHHSFNTAGKFAFFWVSLLAHPEVTQKQQQPTNNP